MAVAAAEAEAAAAAEAEAAEAEAAAALEAAPDAAAVGGVAEGGVAEAVVCPGAPARCARLHSRAVADELNQKSRPAATVERRRPWRHPTSSQIAKQYLPASLIGRSGSSTFRQSTIAVLMSLAGSRFSSDSAPGPLYGAFLVKRFK
jgi:hypothetical protein